MIKITDWAPAEHIDQDERVKEELPQKQTNEVNHVCLKPLPLASHNQQLGSRGVLPVRCNHRAVGAQQAWMFTGG